MLKVDLLDDLTSYTRNIQKKNSLIIFSYDSSTIDK